EIQGRIIGVPAYRPCIVCAMYERIFRFAKNKKSTFEQCSFPEVYITWTCKRFLRNKMNKLAPERKKPYNNI
ncbi:hypothetical protein, partial [Bacillus thuringiensis]